MKTLITLIALVVVACGKDEGKSDNSEKLGYDTREFLWSEDERGLMQAACIDGTFENHANVVPESAVPACKCYIDEIAKTYPYREFMADFDAKLSEFDAKKDECRDKYLKFE